MRIAVFDNSWEGWPTLGEYARAQACSLLLAAEQAPGTEVTVVTQEAGAFALPSGMASMRCDVIGQPDVRELDLAERLFRKLPGSKMLRSDPRVKTWERWASRHGLDVFVSFCPPAWWHACDVSVCVWIPDFQHIHLPAYFADEEIAARNEEFGRWAHQANVVLVSSEAVRTDFAEFSPPNAHKARVFGFPSLLPFRTELGLPPVREVLGRYGVEQDFMLVVNQFFAHKNHLGVIEAMGRLQAEGRCPQVVMIGSTIDHRDKATRAMSRVLSRVAELRLEGRAKILGFVPSEVRDVLLRACKVLIQPSEFEGWNTSIEDAKALGRPIIASDLPAHREQIGSPVGFFEPHDIEALAGLMANAAGVLPSGPDLQREAACIEGAREAACASGGALLAACREAMMFRDRRSRS